MALNSDNRIGLYIAIPLYFVFLAGVAFVTYRWQKRRTSKLASEGIEEDALSAHYLASRSFNPITTAVTMFATLFSGYSVVGIPNEAFRYGYLALRWMPQPIIIAFFYMGTGPRLRRASLVRNHQSPTDFVTDRFRSQTLRYTTACLQLLPAIVYLTAQCTAIRTTFNSIFGIDANNPIAVTIISAIIVIFEWIGGLKCVALTDLVQGTIMCISFVALPFVILKNFGGWVDLNWETYPEPTFYQTPSSESQWLFWSFCVSGMSFFTLPQFIQRTYAAESLSALKVGYKALAIGPWLINFTGIFIGTVGVQMLAGEGSPSSPYAAILKEIMDLGGFPYVVAIITFTASLAAIMSTADSVLIAISQLITSEVVFPLQPNAPPKKIARIGRATSLISMAVALVISLLGGQGLSQIAVIQFGISLQTLPTYMVGLFSNKLTDCHPWSLAFGAWIGFLATCLLQFSYMNLGADIVNVPLNAGVVGCAINVAASFAAEVLHRMLLRRRQQSKTRLSESAPEEDSDGCLSSRRTSMRNSQPLHMGQPGWDMPPLKRYGDVPFTGELLQQCMTGVREPLRDAWFPVLLFIMTLLVTPLVVGGQPPLDANGDLAYEPATVRGMPAWAFATTMYTVFLTLILLVAVSKIPDEFPPLVLSDELNHKGVDEDTVELTNIETGERSSFDKPNTIVEERSASGCVSLEKECDA